MCSPKRIWRSQATDHVVNNTPAKKEIFVSGQFDDSPDDLTAECPNAFHETYTYNPPANEQLLNGHASAQLFPYVDYTTDNQNHIVTPCSSSDADEGTATLQATELPGAQPAQGTKVGSTSYTQFDVLCGRGGQSNHHNGNKEYRLLVDLHREDYFKSRKHRKAEISQAIVSGIRSRGGRFLKRDKATGSWYDVGDVKAVEKTSQALREGAAQRLREILSKSTPIHRVTNPVSPITIEGLPYPSLRIGPKDGLPFPTSLSQTWNSQIMSTSHFCSLEEQRKTTSVCRSPANKNKRWLEADETESSSNDNSGQPKRARHCPSA